MGSDTCKAPFSLNSPQIELYCDFTSRVQKMFLSVIKSVQVLQFH